MLAQGPIGGLDLCKEHPGEVSDKAEAALREGWGAQVYSDSVAVPPLLGQHCGGPAWPHSCGLHPISLA